MSEQRTTIPEALQPEIEVGKFQVNDCLSLQKLIGHMSDKAFEFPSRLVTIELNTSIQSNQFHIYNFGYKENSSTHFPLLAEAEQSNCESLYLTTAYGRKVPYRIETADRNRLVLQLDEAAEAEIERDAAMVEALSKEPTFKRIEVKVTSPLSIELSYSTQTLFPLCNSSRLLSYDKSLRMRWGNSRDEFPNVEPINESYMERTLKMIGGLTPPAPELMSLIRVADADEPEPETEEPESEEPESEEPEVAAPEPEEGETEVPDHENNSEEEVADDESHEAIPESDPSTNNGRYAEVPVHRLADVKSKLLQLEIRKSCN